MITFSADSKRLYSCSTAKPVQLLLVASLPAEAPLEHNFRYPRIRELTVDNDAIALGGPLFLILFSFSSLSLLFPSLYSSHL